MTISTVKFVMRNQAVKLFTFVLCGIALRRVCLALGDEWYAFAFCFCAAVALVWLYNWFCNGWILE
jgi:hypothetical protein